LGRIPTDPRLRLPMADQHEISGGEPGDSRVRIAVRTDLSDEQLSTVLAEFGIDEADIKLLPANGWRSVTLPSKFAQENAAASLSGMLAQRSIFASALRSSADRDGDASIATDGLIVSFKPGVPASWAHKVLAMHVSSTATIVDQFGGDESAYLVYGGFTSGYEVEAAAKRLAQRADVAAAASDDLLIRGRMADVQDQAADLLVEVLASDDDSGKPLALVGDLAQLGAAAQFVPQDGDASIEPHEPQGLLAAMIAAAEQQGRPVYFVNVWSGYGQTAVAQRSMVIEAMGWARDRDARVLMLGNRTEQLVP